MKIQLHNQTKEDIKPIKDILQKIFKPIKNDKNMQIIFLDQHAIHQMNLTYRQIDRPTDVLSFINDDEKDDSIGDIFISIEQARSQALDYGHSFEREIGFLAVHGYLHLLGYDHHTEEEEKLMIIEQERILKNANLERN
ncbi:MAG: rRNA maturation RNase YbeY [Firmicutes bacterium]|nr:rRNA maturation RNase YbeY [Bacillota bacterium]